MIILLIISSSGSRGGCPASSCWSRSLGSARVCGTRSRGYLVIEVHNSYMQYVSYQQLSSICICILCKYIIACWADDDRASRRDVGVPYKRAYALSSYALTYVVYIYIYIICIYIYIYIHESRASTMTSRGTSFLSSRRSKSFTKVPRGTHRCVLAERMLLAVIIFIAINTISNSYHDSY